MIENERQTEQSADGREFSELALGGFSKLVAATEAYVENVEHSAEAFESARLWARSARTAKRLPPAADAAASCVISRYATL